MFERRRFCAALLLALPLAPARAQPDPAAPTGPGHIGPDAFAAPDVNPLLLKRLEIADQQVALMQQERALLFRRVQELEAGCAKPGG